MTLGRCQYMTCASVIGTEFRSAFEMAGRTVFLEVLICPEHERWLRPLRDENQVLCVSAEGFVYPRMWMDALGFLI